MAPKKQSKSKSSQPISLSSYESVSRGNEQELHISDSLYASQSQDKEHLCKFREDISRQHQLVGEYEYTRHEGSPYEQNISAECSSYHPIDKVPLYDNREKSRKEKEHYFREQETYSGLHDESDQPISLVIHERTYEEEPEPSTSSTAQIPTEKKREQTCRFCFNHGQINPKKNHKYQCIYANCECERCEITKDSQKSMREHQRQTRLQKTEYGEQATSLPPPVLPLPAENPQIWEFPESRRKEFEPILTEDYSDLIGKVKKLCKKAKKQ